MNRLVALITTAATLLSGLFASAKETKSALDAALAQNAAKDATIEGLHAELDKAQAALTGTTQGDDLAKSLEAARAELAQTKEAAASAQAYAVKLQSDIDLAVGAGKALAQVISENTDIPLTISENFAAVIPTTADSGEQVAAEEPPNAAPVATEEPAPAVTE